MGPCVLFAGTCTDCVALATYLFLAAIPLQHWQFDFPYHLGLYSATHKQTSSLLSRSWRGQTEGRVAWPTLTDGPCQVEVTFTPRDKSHKPSCLQAGRLLPELQILVKQLLCLEGINIHLFVFFVYFASSYELQCYFIICFPLKVNIYCKVSNESHI